MARADDLPVVSDEDWAKTPASVRALVVALVARVDRLEREGLPLMLT